ncbi:MAG: NAD(P)-dependent oxidoreductase [Alphaproteobacteria bacterium]
MSNQVLRFIDVAQRPPDKRDGAVRTRDFKEIYDQFVEEHANEQAGRCSQCGVPFCQIHCPLGNNIPDWLLMTAEGRLEEAYEIASATNNMPEICGRICPQDRLCEGNCVIEKGFESVTIGAVEKYITDAAWENGWVKGPEPRSERSQSIGIIGAGPAGMAAAEELRRRGYDIHVYDRYDRVGGLLVYGIPNFKLEKHLVERRAALLADGGIAFQLDFEVGRDASLEELRQRHQAVLIATGVHQARDAAMSGAGIAGIEFAMDYLTASNRKGLGDAVADFESGRLDARSKHVVVIGGGDTGMDCVRTAVRQDAASVTCLYRRDRDNMPGSQHEVTHAMEEGVVFEWLAAPEAFLGDDRVSAVRAQRMRLGTPDAGGRQAPKPLPDSRFNLDCDLAIKALGFDPEDLSVAFDAPDLKRSRWGTLNISEASMETSLAGVFAAGDIVRGASLVVWAIKDGRDAADGIAAYLRATVARETSASVAAE